MSETVEPIRLWTLGDIARELDFETSSIWFWAKKGWMPEPYAVAGGKNQRLWTEEQVKQILFDHYERVDKRKITPTGKRKEDNPNIKFDNCPECGEAVFNLKVHADFMHTGKNSIVGARG